MKNFHAIIVQPYKQIYKTGVEISELGDSPMDKFKIKLFGFLCFLQHRFQFPIKITIKIKGFPIVLKHRADMWAIREVFLYKHYNIPAKDPWIIFDLGSNIGMSVIYFKAKYPQAKIYSVEPNPYIFQQLKGNIPKDVMCLNLAIAGYNGKGKFYIDTNHSSSSLIKSASKYIKVNCRTLDSLMKQYNISQIDILKFDIEGIEYEAFKNFRNLNKVKYIIGEVHSNLFKRPFDEFLSLFKKFDLISKKEHKKNIDIVVLKNKNYHN